MHCNEAFGEKSLIKILFSKRFIITGRVDTIDHEITTSKQINRKNLFETLIPNKGTTANKTIESNNRRISNE